MQECNYLHSFFSYWFSNMAYRVPKINITFSFLPEMRWYAELIFKHISLSYFYVIDSAITLLLTKYQRAKETYLLHTYTQFIPTYLDISGRNVMTMMAVVYLGRPHCRPRHIFLGASNPNPMWLFQEEPNHSAMMKSIEQTCLLNWLAKPCV